MKQLIHELAENAIRSSSTETVNEFRLAVNELLSNYVPVNQLEYE